MASTLCKDFESLVAAVERQIPKILLEDVAPVAEEILRKHIKSDIYDVYKPKEGAWVSGTTYERRHVLEESIVFEITNEDTMTVTSNASASTPIISKWSFDNKQPGAFLQMLESGKTGIWKSGFARPVIQNVQKEIDSSSRIIKAIHEGIKGRIG